MCFLVGCFFATVFNCYRAIPYQGPLSIIVHVQVLKESERYQDLIFMGSSPLGGAASAVLESILLLKGGRLTLTAGDSVYAFASYLVHAEDEKSADVLAEAAREVDKAAEADAKACQALVAAKEQGRLPHADLQLAIEDMDEEERESRIAAFRREVHEAVSSIRVSIESTIRARREQLSWSFGPLLKDAVAKLTEGFAGDGADVARALNQPENFLSEQLGATTPLQNDVAPRLYAWLASDTTGSDCNIPVLARELVLQVKPTENWVGLN
jgi:hypothetical protein